MSFKGKVVIITGASSGIGAGAAIYFSKRGAKVVITGRDERNLKETAENCENEVLSIVADVNSEADRVKIINQTLTKFGKIDVLINNAGIGVAARINNTEMKEYDDVMNTNVRSVFHLTQLAVPHLIKSQGNIVNVSSIAGQRQLLDRLAYGMSKAAVDQFTKILALELAPMNVRVNAISPALIVTNFQKRLGLDEAAYEKFKKSALQNHPLGRIGTIEDTNNALAFLADNELASFITGTCLLVDGGMALGRSKI